ncbi:MAG: aldose 1-epimerase [Sphingobium sp.]
MLLSAGEYRLDLAPERGGAVLRFDWRGTPLFRPVCGPSILDTACFPLVPFSNRIAHGRFQAGDRAVSLAPNFPDSDHPHCLHGFGWLSAWEVMEADGRSAVLRHRYPDGEWPWPYVAEQQLRLDAEGLTMALSVTNEGDAPMPAGLGFHPYFPRDPDTLYRGLHRGEWQNSADGLPERLDLRSEAQDWWDGAPVGSRAVDTLYTDREGALLLAWPSRDLALEMIPSPSLRHSVVDSPAGRDFFCVEPVTHMTNALNRADAEGGMDWLAPGETLSASVRMAARPL